jgi:hypothetical protein
MLTVSALAVEAPSRIRAEIDSPSTNLFKCEFWVIFSPVTLAASFEKLPPVKYIPIPCVPAGRSIAGRVQVLTSPA